MTPTGRAWLEALRDLFAVFAESGATPDDPEPMIAAIEAKARAEGAAAERGLTPEAIEWARELMRQGYRDEHIVAFTETGYGLQHPIRCRPDLIGCQYNEWLATQMAPDRDPGRYLMTWRKSGPHYAILAKSTDRGEA